MPHDFELDHEHEHFNKAHENGLAQSIWEQDNVVFQTVGIDIGSSTSHLMFSRVQLKRLSESHSSRFVVVRREVVWRSKIVFTPFLPNGSIDAQHLSDFVDHCYLEASMTPQQIDTGAVILTGEAIKKSNAKAIDEIFASQAGKFVCASAGHELEAILACHGSGATALSARRFECGLHVDIGGGTTKLALIDQGKVLSVCAVAVGGRLLAQDSQGLWTRMDDSARLAAIDLGLEPTLQTVQDPSRRQSIVHRLAQVLVDHILGLELQGLSKELLLTPNLVRNHDPKFITFSGGVSEYIFDASTPLHGDIANTLALELVSQLKGRLAIPVIDSAERIRATVIGASQFTIQVSGTTIFMSDDQALPVHNVPVLRLEDPFTEVTSENDLHVAMQNAAMRLGLSGGEKLALSLTWSCEPEHAHLLRLAKAIERFVSPRGDRVEPLFVLIDGDVAASMGRILRDELHLACPLVCVDGVTLKELDYVDLGQKMEPTGVVPVVIKSLLFG